MQLRRQGSRRNEHGGEHFQWSGSRRIGIPASKISNLTQGMFVGAVSDNFDERIEQKIFHAEIVVDNAAVARETKAYKPIPIVADFTGDDGNDTMTANIEHNYNQIKADVKQIVIDELARIENAPELQHLIKKE